ncbi:MAG TPA: dihydroorotate dehydrogenase [Symbiobacteriaceae bacterium]
MAAEVDLSTELFGIRFRNPVWTASGCFGYGREYAGLFPLRELGAICVKGTSLEPWEGNPGTRVTETPGGMLNAIGLQNPGVEHFLKVDWPWLQEQGATVVVNIVGRTVEEYAAVARRLEGSGVAALELNISCPNVKEGGMAFGTTPRGAAEVTAAVRKATTLPLIVKLSPNVTDVVAIARAVEDAGADGISLINTVLGMSIDIRRRKPHLGNVFGGLSGPAIKPIALRMVWQVAGAVRIPVIGIGGITTWEDAVEFLMAGARAVQVGTACFVNPRAPLEIIRGIRDFMVETGVTRVTDLVGAARPQGSLPELTGGSRENASVRSRGTAPRPHSEAAEALRQFMKDADRA